jgi:hypothetical protein
VPRGSSLYGTPSLAAYVGAFNSESFSYAWTHPDPRMDALQREVATTVEAATASGESPEQTFRTVEQLALKATGGSAGISADDDPFDLLEAAFVPRLTEAWFC